VLESFSAFFSNDLTGAVKAITSLSKPNLAYMLRLSLLQQHYYYTLFISETYFNVNFILP